MLDIHSHILPQMDDGSKSVEMSLEMLRSSKNQGVTTMVSTSHFYADRESPDRFLRRRNHAFEKIESELTDSDPEIILGAEVLYFPGISQSEEVRSLAIEGTSLILIELPFISWSENIFEELMSFQYLSGLQVIAAHVERYRGIQTRSIYEKLFEYPFYFQCNAEAFSSFSTRRLALQLADNDLLHFLGTDCHNITSRPPNMDIARAAYEKKNSSLAWRRLTDKMERRFNRFKKDTEEHDEKSRFFENFE